MIEEGSTAFCQPIERLKKDDAIGLAAAGQATG
jgi:hypothetical protein